MENPDRQYKIKLGIGCPEYVGDLLPLADEVFFGYAGVRSGKRLKTDNHFRDWSAVESLAEQARGAGKLAFLTLNSPFYPPDDYLPLAEVLGRAYSAGIGGVIVADVMMLAAMQEHLSRFYVALSTLCPLHNSQAISYLRRLGVKRFILPNYYLPSELTDLMSAGADMEVMVPMQPCYRTEGNCQLNSYSSRYKSNCYHHFCRTRPNGERAGLQAIYGQFYDAYQAGARLFKLNTRNNSLERSLAAHAHARQLLDALQAGISRSSFLELSVAGENPFPDVPLNER
jgi:hypothetical protein